MSEAEFLERIGGREGSVCVLQLDRDDGGGQSHVVDVSVCRAGEMDEDQLQIPSSYTGQPLMFINTCIVSVLMIVIIVMLSHPGITLSELPVIPTRFFQVWSHRTLLDASPRQLLQSAASAALTSSRTITTR